MTADGYPDDWPEIAARIKKRFHNRCERCDHWHDPATGYTLTVHHLVPDKMLVEDWNLAALCQRCHLSVQGRVDMFQDILPGVPVSAWFVPHLQGFYAWRVVQAARKIALLTVGGEKPFENIGVPVVLAYDLEMALMKLDEELVIA